MNPPNRRQCRDCRQPLDRTTQAWRCPACGARRMLVSVRGTPSLDGALCLGRWADFDPPDPAEPAPEQRLQTAVQTCSRCPALDPCTTWIDGLTPGNRPYGVVAGRVIPEPHQRRRHRPPQQEGQSA